MIKINLLPYREIIRKENIINHGVIAGGAVVLVLVIIVIVNSVICGKIDNVNNEIARKEREIASNKVSM